MRKRLSKEERKLQIQKAAKKVLLENGYENTTMENIISETGMSIGGVYHYYKSVFDIFYDIMLEGLDYGKHRNFENPEKDLNIFIDYQMAKIFDDNEYKSLFAMLLKGIDYNDELREMYLKLNDKYKEILCKNFERSSVPIEILDDSFLIFFVHSLIMGNESFVSLGSKEVFKENKEIVKKMIVLYLSERYLSTKKNNFEEERK